MTKGIYAGVSPNTGKKMFLVDVLSGNFNEVSPNLTNGVHIPTAEELDTICQSDGGKEFLLRHDLADAAFFSSTPAKGNEEYYVVRRHAQPLPHEKKIDYANHIENKAITGGSRTLGIRYE